jgi:hypothetical protein
MQQIQVNSVVKSGRRIGRVVCIDRRGKLLVLWTGSSVAGWNRPGTVKLLAA